MIVPEALDGERLREIRAAFDADPRLWEKIDTSGGTLRADEAVSGDVLCRVYADGEAVALYTLHFYQEENRTEAFITLALGRGPLDLCVGVLPLIEKQCAGCAGLGMRTKRKGLMRKLARAGYETVSVRDGVAQMRKPL
ncbi:hypothetical protein [Paraburkholderia hospita]|uniref:hypothetical protein n=1 Tax=Paraburkholderia hospita TaxID=169430 RepID=UPI001177F9E0|nr:hypothetical protein [Paraburkholderia hospita]